MSSSAASLQQAPGAVAGGTSPYSASSSFLPSFMIIAALLAFVFLASVSIHLLLRFLSDRASSSSSSAPPLPQTTTRRRDDEAAAWTPASASVPRPVTAAHPAAAADDGDGGGNKKAAGGGGDEKQRLIDSLPLFTMASALAALPRSSPDCAVCLSPFTPDAELRLLPACRHAFHAACVDAWLRTATPSCPLCRAAVVALPNPSALSAMLAAAQRPPSPSPPRARDRSGPSFLVEMGTVSNRGSSSPPGTGDGGGDRNSHSRSRSRTYSLGSFDYQIDEEVEAVVSRVARVTVKEEEQKPPAALERSSPAPAPAPPSAGETAAAEAAGNNARGGWLREYVDRLASSAYTLSERWSARWSQQGQGGGQMGQQQRRQDQEEPWLWDAEAAAAGMSAAAPGSDEEGEETAFMAMYRWIAGV